MPRENTLTLKGVQPRGGAGQGGGPPQRGFLEPEEDDARPLGARRGASGGGLEPGAGRGKGHSGAVVSLVDRASEFVFLQRADRRTAAAVSAAMLEMLRPSAAPVHTVTSDNGREFAGHAGVAAELGAAFHFATPYHSWERGLDGHTNGLAPQYLPKGTDLRAVSDAEVRAVRDRTDARPRRATGRPPRRCTRPALPDAARPPPTGAGRGAGRGGMDFAVASVRAPVGLGPAAGMAGVALRSGSGDLQKGIQYGTMAILWTA